jgi:hypothetical protein
MDMDPFEMFKIVQDVYIAGLRARAQAVAIERLTAGKFCGGSNLALIRKGDPDEDHSIAATVCKDRRLPMQ